MRKILTLLLAFSLVFILNGCAEQSSISEAENNTIEQDNFTVSKNSQTEETNDINKLEAIGDVEVDKGLFNVTIQVPSDFAEAEKTQADYDLIAKEKGWKSITLNEDGSLTYEMTKNQHKELMNETVKSFRKSLDEMISSGEYENFVNIEVNADYSEFTVITKSEELDMTESFSTMAFYMMSGMYNIFNGTAADNCKVVFINEISGEIIQEANSKDMGN